MGAENKEDKDKIIREMMEKRELTNEALKKLLDNLDVKISKPERKEKHKRVLKRGL